MSEPKSEKKPEKGKEKPKAGGGGQATTMLVEMIVVLLVALFIAPLLVTLFSLGNWPSVAAAFGKILSSAKIIATVVSMAAVAIAVYAFVSLHSIMAAETGKLGLTLSWEKERREKNDRWERVLEYMRSLNSSDWKMAILEADNILDEVVERMGYKGETLGERMKMIEASDFPYLDEAWKAHKLRNVIAHTGGSDYVLTRAQAEQTINVYQRVFTELGYL